MKRSMKRVRGLAIFRGHLQGQWRIEWIPTAREKCTRTHMSYCLDHARGKSTSSSSSWSSFSSFSPFSGCRLILLWFWFHLVENRDINRSQISARGKGIDTRTMLVLGLFSQIISLHIDQDVDEVRRGKAAAVQRLWSLAVLFPGWNSCFSPKIKSMAKAKANDRKMMKKLRGRWRGVCVVSDTKKLAKLILN